VSTRSRRVADTSRRAEPDRSDQVRRLETEVAGLRRALRTRGLIEQAKGRLAERWGVDAEEAFRRLKEQSQQTNVSVVNLAADVMGVGPEAQSDDDIEALRWDTRAVARLSAATAPADLVDLLVEPGWMPAVSVALFAAQPAGSLRLLAAQGWSAALRADWQWVPSAVRTPASEAIRRCEPVWLDAPGPFVFIGAGLCRAALPICVEGKPVAAVEVVFPDGHAVDQATRRSLSAAAAALGNWFAASSHAQDTPIVAAPSSLDVMLDGVVAPGALLSPMWTNDGEIEDFRIDQANPAAVASWQPPGPVDGRRLLDVDPDALTDGSFDAFVRAYRGQSPADELGCRAVRVGGRLLATWRARGGSGGSAGRVAAMEDLGSFGWGEWNRSGKPLMWSPGLYRILGRASELPPWNLERLLATIEPEDRGLAGGAFAGVVHDGQPVAVEVSLRRANGDVRSVRMAVAARLDHAGSPRAVVALFQDRTDARVGAEAAADAAERLAIQRMRAAFERAQTEQLRSAFFPPPWTGRRYGKLTVAARHVAPSGIHSFRGDFYEIDQSDAALLLLLGDVFGSGIAAAHAMVRLRHTARALALIGLPVAEVLDLLNRDLWRDEEPPMASMVVAAVDPDGQTLTWAQAGHYSPILVRQGRARSLRRPRGDVLGLLASGRYGQAKATLQAGDLLVFFTDGVLQRWDDDTSPIRRLAAECVKAHGEGGAQSLLDRLLPPAEDEACLVAVEWAGD
jgi:Stage II sporulation protein E (SpoIIE)/ANTAR domain/PAS fold